MLANTITLSRFPLLFLSLLALYLGPAPVRLVGVALLFAGLMLDTVDGIVARRRGQTSLLGSVLDIAADRTYELVLWVCFANLGMISAIIPLIVLVRTTLTDALRSIEVGRGTAPFAQHRTALGRFLVGSTWMRVGYAVSKVVTFCGFALVQALGGFAPGAPVVLAVPMMSDVFRVTAWITVGFCVLRGLPVLTHAARHYWKRSQADGTSPSACEVTP